MNYNKLMTRKHFFDTRQKRDIFNVVFSCFFCFVCLFLFLLQKGKMLLFNPWIYIAKC